jgi:hypothetical protein
MFKKLIILSSFLFSPTLLSTPDARFQIFPSDGNLIAIGCQTDDNDECAMQDYVLDTMMIPYGKSVKKFPGLAEAPGKVYHAISAAAEAMGDVSYVHVAVTHQGITYEYMYDKDTGWNSFRALPAGKKCKLECKPKISDDSNT